MINLNIISPEQKKEIKLNAIYDSIRAILVILLLILVFYSAAFIIIKKVMESYYEDTLYESSLTNKSTEDYNSTSRVINEKINEIAEIQKDYFKFTDFINFISKNIDDSIQINKLMINRDTNQILISGFAPNRDSLLALKEMIESLDNFSEFNLPMKTLLEKENINFEINTKIESYEFE